MTMGLETEMARSGAAASRQASARAGFLPLPLDQVQVAALDGIPVHLRTANAPNQQDAARFTLYCSETSRFTDFHRTRLHEAGVRFIYIPMSHHGQFRRQLEQQLLVIATDPKVALSAKSELVYQTSVELINELLEEQSCPDAMPRLGRVAKAVSTLIVQEPKAFSHLFAAAQHDFYTATHMVNVGTWMVALAYALGVRDENQLESICTAGMVHDVGKVYVPEDVLNKPGVLSDQDWNVLRSHPRSGAEHLAAQGVTDETVLRVTLEHHERLDGSGYPARLKGDQIHRISRICAVVDSFDAMTALRPFRKSAKPMAEAVRILRAESGTAYDPEMVQAWIGLLNRAAGDGLVNEPVEITPEAADRVGRRAHQRYTIDCPARACLLHKVGDSWEQGEAIPARAHSISRGGLGFLVQRQICVSSFVRMHMRGAGTLENRILEGQVVRCRAYGDGWFEVGMKFSQPGADEEAAARLH